MSEKPGRPKWNLRERILDENANPKVQTNVDLELYVVVRRSTLSDITSRLYEVAESVDCLPGGELCKTRIVAQCENIVEICGNLHCPF